MPESDTTQPSEAALHTLAEAVDEEGLEDIHDGVDAAVRTAVKHKQLVLDPDEDIDDYVLDLVKDAYAKAWEMADDFDSARRLTPWIIGIAGTILLSRSRDAGRQRDRDRDPNRFDVRLVGDEVNIDDLVDPSEEDLFAALEHKDDEAQTEARLTVEAVLDALDNGGYQQHAEILRRHYLKDESVEELAEAYGISVDAVHQRLSRARRHARKVDRDL